MSRCGEILFREKNARLVVNTAMLGAGRSPVLVNNASWGASTAAVVASTSPRQPRRSRGGSIGHYRLYTEGLHDNSPFVGRFRDRECITVVTSLPLVSIRRFTVKYCPVRPGVSPVRCVCVTNRYLLLCNCRWKRFTPRTSLAEPCYLINQSTYIT